MLFKNIMELPDDVVCLIREFSRPLKRRYVGDAVKTYMKDGVFGIYDIDALLRHVIEAFCHHNGYDEDTVVIEKKDEWILHFPTFVDEYRMDDAYIYFSLEELLVWDCDDFESKMKMSHTQYYLLKDKIIHTELLNDNNKLVSIIKYN